ncbi:MAG: hypothetical protein V3V08_17350 [Nannocystaceae bacterium]
MNEPYLFTLSGGAELIVPPHIHVLTDGIGIMGGFGGESGRAAVPVVVAGATAEWYFAWPGALLLALIVATLAVPPLRYERPTLEPRADEARHSTHPTPPKCRDTAP